LIEIVSMARIQALDSIERSCYDDHFKVSRLSGRSFEQLPHRGGLLVVVGATAAAGSNAANKIGLGVAGNTHYLASGELAFDRELDAQATIGLKR